MTNLQSLNKYQYSYNNPLRYTDPDGHTPCCNVAGSVNDFVQGAQGLDPRLAKAAAIAGAAILGTAAIYENTSWEDVKAGAKRFLRGSDDGIQCFDGGCSPAIMNKSAEQGSNTPKQQAQPATPQAQPAAVPKTTPSQSPGFGKGWVKQKGNQGYKDPAGNSWKKDQLHKDHWDISNSKGKKVREVDFNGNEIWPNGPKNKNKQPKT